MKRDGYYWRILATGFSFLMFGIGGLVLGLVVLPLLALLSTSRERSLRRCRFAVRCSFRFFIGLMETLGVLTWEVRGGELLKRPGQLVVANHPSLIDIVFLMAFTPGASCIVRAGLFNNPFTAGPVRWSGYVCNDSGEPLIEECAAQLTAGGSLIIFPEGTRSVRGKPLSFRRGAAHIKLRTNCPLVLVSITVSPPTLAKGEKWYQIPLQRPHFCFNACDNILPDVTSARELNRQWRNYFSNENPTT